MASDLLERQLVRAWQRGLRGPLCTVDGLSVEVVYRGHCPGGAGPDVRAALIAIGGGRLVEGDVEFHRRTSDWYGHGHQGDGRYRAIILHIVLEHDAAPPSDAAGQPVPTVVVLAEELAESRAGAGIPGPAQCHDAARERGVEAIGTILDHLGDRRLTQRAARFEAELSRLTPEALAYEALFDALGFSRNRAPFVRLAQTVSIELLLALLGRRPDTEALVLAEAILFGVAGLLPSQRDQAASDWEVDETVEELESIWSLYHADWEGQCLTESEWIFGGVRQANYPTRRIATAARLIARLGATGIDVALLAPLRSGQLPGRELEQPYVVEDPTSYWATHCDFGRPLPGARSALLGRDRARDAVVNVTFPLGLAIAAATGDQLLAETVWNAYRLFPRPAAYEATQRLALDLGLTSRALSTARRQQGLLHLVRNHCERAACSTCPLHARDD
jgi:hypothetical protein